MSNEDAHAFFRPSLSWRTVSTSHLIRVANAFSSGVDFVGCSKRDIYDSIRKNFYRTDLAGFSACMDRVAMATRRAKDELNVKIHEIIVDERKKRA